MNPEIPDIFSHFNLSDHLVSYNRYGSGHINDTFIIHTKGNNKYILQRINKAVFQNISGLMNNINIVLGHFSNKQPLNNKGEYLTLIKTKDHLSYFTDQNENSWRCYSFIEKSRSFNKIDSPHLAFEAGYSFGHFQYLLTDLNPSGLVDTIPHFHNLKMRMSAFEESLLKAQKERLDKANQEIQLVISQKERFLEFNEKLTQGTFPVRICHNDTKINNILFNDQLHAKCVIDLDTVMPGSVLYDFGDAIRTGANLSDEDDDNPSNATLDLNLFESFSRGYLSMAKSFLTENEVNHLAFSVQFMTFIIGLRFLTDYLSDDVYFKTSKPDHNLIRTKVQFHFLVDVEKKKMELEDIINHLYN